MDLPDQRHPLLCLSPFAVPLHLGRLDQMHPGLSRRRGRHVCAHVSAASRNIGSRFRTSRVHRVRLYRSHDSESIDTLHLIARCRWYWANPMPLSSLDPRSSFSAKLKIASVHYSCSSSVTLRTHCVCTVDAVLLQQGQDQLVSKGREVGKSGPSGASKLGKSITKPLNKFSKEGLIRYLVSLPLNAIPVVGTVLFLLYNGTPVALGL